MKPVNGLPVQSMSKVTDWQCLTVYPMDFIGGRVAQQCFFKTQNVHDFCTKKWLFFVNRKICRIRVL